MSPVERTRSEPQPVLERDEYGRVQRLTFASDAPTRSQVTGRWLVALDGSANSLRALDSAVRLMPDTLPGVDLVYVHPPLSIEAAESELGAFGWNTTEAARERLRRANRRWCLHVLTGAPATGIAELASRMESACIVVGARGTSAVEALLMGSVTQELIRVAPAPVLVVR
jgi:nucleotide-binding universal stress UspA family protein